MGNGVSWQDFPTASFLANVYLMEVDRHFQEAGVIYARYSDDIILFAEDREALDRHRSTLLAFFDKYRLTVNPSKERVYSPENPMNSSASAAWATQSTSLTPPGKR